MSTDDLPLPYGWIKEFDPSSRHHFYVDTKAKPPRSIWVHPFKDEQYLAEHPDVREKVNIGSQSPPPRVDRQTRPPSYSAESGPSTGSSSSRMPVPDKTAKPNWLGKLKDKTIGTKEERDAKKREEAELAERRREQRRAERAARAQFEREAQYNGGYGYGPPVGNPYGGRGYPGAGGYPGGGYPGAGGYPDPGYPGAGYGGGGTAQRGGGMGGMALPLVGGIAGGLILGELLGDEFGGGGFGGGDFGGGDFGGGDFGGGDFGGGDFGGF